jgi:basic amino acid/polyamine antiporter, APA family
MSDLKETDSNEVTLKRTLNLPLLILYGLGTTVGGGIYVLVGRVAGRAGLYAPISFLVAALLVACTALSFAELSSRFPRSAGEAVYVEEGLGRKDLAIIVGILIILNGIISSAALTNGFVGYIQTLLPISNWLAIVGIVVLLALLACWGIAESVLAAAIVTIIEIGGLLLIIWAGKESLSWNILSDAALVPPMEAVAWGGILAGSFLAFYAFIGFEDMVNVAEEVQNPRRVIPISIMLVLGITTIIYVAVTLVAILSVPTSELATNDAPLVLIYEKVMGQPGTVISLISITALINGALIQIIMASRVIYGMSKRGWLPTELGAVNKITRTPIRATLFISLIIIVLALGFNIEVLASITSLVFLVISVLVNASLFQLKRLGVSQPEAFTVPIWVPAGGFLISLTFAALVFNDLI